MPLHRPLIVLLSLLCHCACNTTPATPRNGSDVQWNLYHNEKAAYSLRYPDFCTLDEEGKDAILRWDDSPIICINFVDKEEGKARGLWARHEAVAKIQLDGRAGLKYVYKHCDGPFCMRTISYVVAHGDRYLGLEFRTEEDELGAVYKQVVASFQFD